MMEQFELPLEPESPKFAERDECGRCGNAFEGPGTCVECTGNALKKAYLSNHPEVKLPERGPVRKKLKPKRYHHERN
jgi:hypothetical protein